MAKGPQARKAARMSLSEMQGGQVVWVGLIIIGVILAITWLMLPIMLIARLARIEKVLKQIRDGQKGENPFRQ